ncbi:MAG TPA: YlmC/YmxH family sporulation protein [Clostridiales bacterium]|nr:YlmC/YmxH family sporulation protein [Clostridiales bacterium]
MVRASDLRMRDVVNVLDGTRLGLISDFEMDLETGKVTAFIVPGPGRFLGFIGREVEYVIPWERIKKIGTDVILVDIPGYTDPRPSR